MRGADGGTVGSPAPKCRGGPARSSTCSAAIFAPGPETAALADHLVGAVDVRTERAHVVERRPGTAVTADSVEGVALTCVPEEGKTGSCAPCFLPDTQISGGSGGFWQFRSGPNPWDGGSSGPNPTLSVIISHVESIVYIHRLRSLAFDGVWARCSMLSHATLGQNSHVAWRALATWVGVPPSHL